jgi:hypothetical protein
MSAWVHFGTDIPRGPVLSVNHNIRLGRRGPTRTSKLGHLLRSLRSKGSTESLISAVAGLVGVPLGGRVAATKKLGDGPSHEHTARSYIHVNLRRTSGAPQKFLWRLLHKTRREDQTALRDCHDGPKRVWLRGSVEAMEESSERRDGPIVHDYHDGAERGLRAYPQPDYGEPTFGGPGCAEPELTPDKPHPNGYSTAS